MEHSALKINVLSSHEKTHRNLKCTVKKSLWKGYILYDSKYMTFGGKAKLWRQQNNQ